MASPSANTLQHNVRSYGAKGDGTTDDTAAIQAAITAAGATGTGSAYIPPGNYKISSTLTLDDESVRLTGALGNNSDPSPGTWTKSGVRIFGSVNGPLISATHTAGDEACTVIEDIGLHNTHATGTCIYLEGVTAPAGVFRCFIRGHIGVNLGINCFNPTVANCTLQLAGTTRAGSRGIVAPSGQLWSNDINGFERGIDSKSGCTIIGGRIEVCDNGLYLGYGGFSFSGFVSSLSFEANDIGIYSGAMAGALFTSIGINGHAGSPSGGSLIGVRIGEVNSATFVGVAEAGTHLTAFIQTNEFAAPHNALTFIGCRNNTGAWSLITEEEVMVINCVGINDIIKLPVIATGSLPAAASHRDGRAIIEDNGAGDRNLIIYAGGQRFRIDGGAAV